MDEKEEGFDFLKEKIKDKPINKKKLLRRTIITVSMAVIFGLVACTTFILLEPVISDAIYPEEGPTIVTFPEEEEDEILPEDMLLVEPESIVEPSVVTEKVDLEIVDYEQLYSEFRLVAKEASKSVVTVTSVETSVDWFQNPYETENIASGILVAENGLEYIAIVDEKLINRKDNIIVTFCDGKQVQGTIKNVNESMGLLAISVLIEDISQKTQENIAIGVLGSSTPSNILATPVLAIGSPMGYTESMAYGMVTSIENTVKVVDSSCQIITTDIYGSQNASGAIINLKGEIIGMIHQGHNSEDMQNMISGWGISNLRNVIEKLSNNSDFAYIGIYGTEVSKDISEQLDMPKGAYVAEIDMNSPAMNAGIQNGDIITKIDKEEITSYKDYINCVNKLKPEETISITLMRQAREEYQEMQVNVVVEILD